jgi:hypothetical protein
MEGFVLQTVLDAVLGDPITSIPDFEAKQNELAQMLIQAPTQTKTQAKLWIEDGI